MRLKTLMMILTTSGLVIVTSIPVTAGGACKKDQPGPCCVAKAEIPAYVYGLSPNDLGDIGNEWLFTGMLKIAKFQGPYSFGVSDAKADAVVKEFTPPQRPFGDRIDTGKKCGAPIVIRTKKGNAVELDDTFGEGEDDKKTDVDRIYEEMKCPEEGEEAVMDTFIEAYEMKARGVGRMSDDNAPHSPDDDIYRRHAILWVVLYR